MIECPECSTQVRGAKCRCGWVVPQAKREAHTTDSMHGCCDWVADGRCHYPGVFKHGERWMCRHHDNITDPIAGAQIVEESRLVFPHPDHSHAAARARSLALVEHKAEAFSALRTKQAGVPA